MKTSQEEKEIVKKIINKDTMTFFRFYKKNYSLVFNFIKNKITDKGKAEELTQDVFLDFIEALRDFHFQSSLTTFILAIAKNKVIDEIRKKKIKKILFSHLPNFLVESLRVVFIEEELDKKELRKKIETVFKKLPKDYRLILRLKYIENKKVTQIAKKFKMKFKATESLLFRARKAFIRIFKYHNL
jgi:RNA polymerase sigma-70 factor (ECF subfamily)